MRGTSQSLLTETQLDTQHIVAAVLHPFTKFLITKKKLKQLHQREANIDILLNFGIYEYISQLKTACIGYSASKTVPVPYAVKTALNIILGAVRT